MCYVNGNTDESAIADIVFAFLERRKESVEKLCKRVIRGGFALRNVYNAGNETAYSKGRNRFPLEEALSECTIRAFDAVRTFDASKGASLDTHILGTLRLYLTKLIYTRTPAREAWRKEKLLERAETQSFEHGPDYSADEIEIIQIVMNSLEQDDSALLELRFLNDCSLEEIAEIFDCSTSKVCVKIQEALDKARIIYNETAW